MNKKIVIGIITLAFAILITIGIIIIKSNSNSLDETVPTRFANTIEHLLSNNLIRQEEIRSKDELELDYELDSIGEYEGVLIKNDDQGNYQEIALIIPKEESTNDIVLLRMIKRYEAVKKEHSEIAYLREPKNIYIKQQNGVSIFVLSYNAKAIYEIVSNSKI